MYVLAINAGSSTLKAALYHAQQGVVRRVHIRFVKTGIAVSVDGELASSIEAPSNWDERYLLALKHLLQLLPEQPAVVTHRVVHGGPTFQDHQVIDAAVLEQLRDLIPFAPLHQPYNLKLIEVCAEQLPAVKQVACFDTVFHSTLPEVAQRYALPYSCYEQGERVYGYHGLSYEYICQAFAGLYPEYADDKVIIAHLGSGVSMCGVSGGRSQATTMGFSTFEGLPMSTRPGHIDPGLIFYWLDQGRDQASIEKMLYKESGLLGLSGISADYQVLEDDESAGAKRAVESFVFSINKALGEIVAQLGGVDHLIFSAGIGENSAVLREQVVEKASTWLPVMIDKTKNQGAERSICVPESAVKVWVLPTNEEQMMVLHAKRLVEEP